ncbi:hypothetical protein F8M41_020856 [Gigaspora margarita]|uniref:Uncharacterized protein n=1 Tax=Gigaspora margarita TaxID=4874 RepID=A0A8H4EJG3_GIGMA|nr:hypothetical protein F8M41_020856 [Gigaspora margarita]
MTFQTEPVFKGHYIITIFLAGVGWIVLLGGAGAITAFYDDVVGSYNKLLSSSSSVGSKLGSQINSQVNSQMNGVFAALWLYVIYQFIFIIGIFIIVAKNAMKHYRLVVLSFIIINFISNCNFAFLATIASGTSIIALFPDLGSKFNALIAGLSILAIVNIIWIIIIGSEDDSTLVKTIDSYYDKKNKNDSTSTRFAPQPTSTYTSDA